MPSKHPIYSQSGPKAIKLYHAQFNRAWNFNFSKKLKMLKNKDISSFKLSDIIILPINIKIATIVGILIFMSRIKFVLSWAQHQISLITSRPRMCLCCSHIFSQRNLNTLQLFRIRVIGSHFIVLWYYHPSRNVINRWILQRVAVPLKIKLKKHIKE